MSDVNAELGTFKAYCLVRDKDGNPQFNDWNNIPEVYNNSLTEKDWEYIKKQREER